VNDAVAQQLTAAPAPDERRMRGWRLARLRAELAARDVAGILLYDPVNIRYATGSRNMAVWTLHNAARYAYVPTDGPVVLFDFHNCAHLSAGLETIGEVRPAISATTMIAGPRAAERTARWADEIAALVGRHRRLAVDRCDPPAAFALAARGLALVDGQQIMEQARLIKSADEIAAMRAAIAVCEAGMAAMHEALRPGISENALWSILHQANIARGGEWIETRLLASGPRTNPWFQECGERVIEAGDLVSFDTDLIGPYGMCADISRSFLCGEGRATPAQRRLYGLALEQIEHNLALLRPGLSLLAMSERAWRLPASCVPNRYAVIFHGVGLADEYPSCYYPEERAAVGYDDVLAPGMTLCLESYIGEVGGREGVKLEQQVLITDTGAELLSSFPFEGWLTQPWL
jgi:Xaa-Pro aminopeptidase